MIIEIDNGLFINDATVRKAYRSHDVLMIEWTAEAEKRGTQDQMYLNPFWCGEPFASRIEALWRDKPEGKTNHG